MGRASLGSVVVVIGIEIKDPEEVAAGLEQPVDRIDIRLPLGRIDCAKTRVFPDPIARLVESGWEIEQIRHLVTHLRTAALSQRRRHRTGREIEAEDVIHRPEIRQGADGEVKVVITKPEKSTKTLAAGTYFPVQHSIALIEAAKAGKDKFRADIYDGSEKGEKAYDTSARIGKIIQPGATALPALKGGEPLDKLTAWPVTISYYERGQSGQDATPVYELSFVFFENGVSRKLVIDYGEFAIKGELTALEFLEPAKCEQK